MFGDAVHKLGGGDPKTGRHIYFALYQSLDSGKDDEARLYLQFPPDYFNLVIVDECHRGSSTESSQWRAILGLTPAVVGARKVRVSAERLLAIKVPLPDLDEQRRIAARLDSLCSRSWL